MRKAGRYIRQEDGRENMNNMNTFRLPKLISDGMVLQRDSKVKIWGWADAGVKVTVSFFEKNYSTIADKDGKWAVILDELQVGGPYNMKITADTTITIKDVLVGDVWICSGQSNMVIPMDRVKDLYMDEIANCNNSLIRQFTVPDRYDFNHPKEDLETGKWEAADAENILQFSAVGYFFAKELFEKYKVPIGLIRASVGGSPVEAWMSEEALKGFPEYLKLLEPLREDSYVSKVKEEDETNNSSWFNKLDLLDKGMQKGEKCWFDPDFDASDWKIMQLPGNWQQEGIGRLNGAVWFRKDIYVPTSMTGKPARLLMGRIVDSDRAYINGTLVGSTSYQYPPRRYDVPDNLLKAGENTIVMRVVSNSGEGEFIKDKPYRLIAGDEIIDLKGEWKYNIGATLEPLPSATFFQYKPIGLFNGMLAPLLNYNMKGVIWYQGESNTDNPKGYRQLFSTMIADWRQRWKQGEFPFLYVQLANYMESKAEPSESNWAKLREEQRRSLDVPNTGMAVAIDLGEWNDLHPLNKKDVGYRLALAAQRIAYGDSEVVHSGPFYNSMKLEGSKVVIEFTAVGTGLIAKGNAELKGFAIAGTDKKFVWAKAIIEEDKVIVWNDEIENPAFVRYAWADNPEGSNLYNKEGLPASPFTTEE